MLIARDLWVAPPGSDCPPALRGISLTVERGEWVAITGPNGCGKTSLALALAGLWPARRGELLLDDLRLGPNGDPAARAAVAAVLQEPASQLLSATVAEELRLAADNLGLDRAQTAAAVRRWSARLGLDDDLERDPRALSAGRQQLVLLGAAMVARPRLLVADEAGAHLDPSARARVLEALGEELGRGLSVIWVTQEPSERRAAHRTLCLEPPAGSGGGPAPRASADGLAGGGSGPPDGRDPGLEVGRPALREPLLSLEVSPWDGENGPHVAIDQPLRVEIARGVLALEGRNGSGKSVLLAAAAGLLEVDQVRVTWRRRAEPAPILVSQFPELQLFEERVADEVAYAAMCRGLKRSEALSRAAAAFDVLDLGGAAFLERRSWDLSSGEKRLMQVVAALIAPAALVLLDEPTCGLDAERRLGVSRMVQERACHDPVVVATQDTGWARAAGARLAVAAKNPSSMASISKKNGLTEPCPES